MMDAIHELRTRAEILHRKIQAGDHRALGRLRKLPAFRRASYEDLASAPGAVRRAHCLSVLAAELGFANWPEAKRALSGAAGVENFGTLLCHPHSSAHLNLWFKTYNEASAAHTAHGGYLLAYGRHYFVADRFFIAESLGLDPEDADWAAMRFDWVRPASVAARSRLYAKLVALLPREAA